MFEGSAGVLSGVAGVEGGGFVGGVVTDVVSRVRGLFDGVAEVEMDDVVGGGVTDETYLRKHSVAVEIEARRSRSLWRKRKALRAEADLGGEIGNRRLLGGEIGNLRFGMQDKKKRANIRVSDCVLDLNGITTNQIFITILTRDLDCPYSCVRVSATPQNAWVTALARL
ncbi:hypothetical protein LXL04_030872 [Taraxacum kok-saghyz]